jgi:hypothetical protein
LCLILTHHCVGHIAACRRGDTGKQHAPQDE